MTAPQTTAQNATKTLLIIDKDGIIGRSLARQLAVSFPVALLTTQPASSPAHRFSEYALGKKVPTLPAQKVHGVVVVDAEPGKEKKRIASLVQEAYQKHIPFVYLSSSFLLTKTQYSHLRKKNPEAKILLYADLIDPEGQIPGYVTGLLRQVRQTKQITLAESGLGLLFPALLFQLGPVVQAILSQSGSQTQLLFPLTGMTELTFARALQRRFPLLATVFAKGTARKVSLLIPSGSIAALTQDAVVSRLALLDVSPLPLIRRYRSSRARRLLKRLVLTGSIVSCSALVVLLFFLLTFLLATKSADYLLSQAEQLPLSQAQQVAQLSQLSQAATQTILENLQPVSDMVGQEPLWERVEQHFVQQSELVTFYARYFQTESQLQSVFFPAQSAADLLKITSDLRDTMTRALTVQAEGLLPPEQLQQITANSASLQASLDIMPDLLGSGQSVMYLVLLENNLQPRPGGGKIESYGLLTLKNGRLNNFSLFPADTPLIASQSALAVPFSLHRFLHVNQVSMQTANLEPTEQGRADLATLIAYLQQKQNTAGVISLDLEAFRALLTLSGPIRVQGETVQADTLYAFLEKRGEETIFPSGASSPSILHNLFQQMLPQLEQEAKQHPYALLSAFSQEQRRGHIQISLRSSPDQSGFAALFPGGENAANGLCALQETSLTQYNTAAYIHRSLSQDVSISSAGDVTGTLTLRYENTSREEKDWQGVYKAYLQLLLPKGADITGITIDGEDQKLRPMVTNERTYTAPHFAPPDGLELEEQQLPQAALFGWQLAVPLHSQKTIKISYTLPETNLFTTPHPTYELSVPKIPGSFADSFAFSLTFPKELHLSDVPSGMQLKNNKLNYTTELEQSVNKTISFDEAL